MLTTQTSAVALDLLENAISNLTEIVAESDASVMSRLRQGGPKAKEFLRDIEKAAAAIDWNYYQQHQN